MTSNTPLPADEIEDIITKLTNAKQIAVETSQQLHPIAPNSELVAPANELLERLRAEAAQAIRQRIAVEKINARIDEERSYWWHQQKLAAKEGMPFANLPST